MNEFKVLFKSQIERHENKHQHQFASSGQRSAKDRVYYGSVDAAAVERLAD